MEKNRLEAKVFDLVTRVVVGRGDVEDDECECKAEWPMDFPRTARQIAGLANAARGRDVLWLIGVDEKDNRVTEVEQNEMSNWWSSVEAEFDGIAPDLQNLWVPTDYGFVMALLFSTDRSPYAIKIKDEKAKARVVREVPWRQGNSTYTAKREQLLSILVETASIPEIELFAPQLDLTGTTLTFTATLDITATPPMHRPPLLPRRSWSVRVESDEWVGRKVSLQPEVSRHITKESERFFNPVTDVLETRRAEFDPESPYGVFVRRVGLIVTGSDTLTISASADVGDLARDCDGPCMSVVVEFPIERTDRVARSRCDLRWTTLDDEDDLRKALWTERD